MLAGDPVPSSVQIKYNLWDFFVLANLRRMIGMDRLRRGGTGAAPISPDLLEWFWGIGVPVLEGFGQTVSVTVPLGRGGSTSPSVGMSPW